MNINTLKQYAVARTFFTPTSLESAVTQLGFVQIDPIRAPACAQDLMLRHRVADYAKGGLDCAYPSSALEEVYFINHGVMPRAQALSLWSRKPLTDFLHNHADAIQMVQALLNTTPELDSRSLNQKLGNQLVTNGWGAQGQAGTQLLQRMHSAGLLRIARREKGQRVYGLPTAQVDVDLDAMVAQAFLTFATTYAPFSHASLTYMARLLGVARPDAKPQIKAALAHACDYFGHALIDGVRWYWPKSERPAAFEGADVPETVRVLTPFDPLVWDRDRFALFWGWTYKFEAYKPAHARQFGYYAQPLLWGNECIGWANINVLDGVMQVGLGYVHGAPQSLMYQKALADELARMALFLQCSKWALLN